ncbi:MAG: hypothetical protein IKO19_03130 [Candidatus Riflebacteria bacterium]|nr:hypothetical protein [Candidatus Riflebacteria bacterium]
MSGKVRLYLLSFFTVFCAVIFFYLTGCCSKGGSGFVVGNVGGNNQSEPKYLDIYVNKEDGSVTKTLAPSGRLSIEAPKNTFHEDVVIHLVENQAMGNESEIFTVSSFIYAIRPDREEKMVKMQNNPLILTFFNEERLEGAGNYYIGIKEIGDKEWQFDNVYSSTNPMINSNGPKGSFEYKLYKDNVLVALFADFNKNIKDKPKVLSMVASMPHNIIETLDGRYNENAIVKLCFIGDNLAGLKADDFRIRLRYANSANNLVNIKIDGKNADYYYDTTNKYEAFGKLYAHYFEFVPNAASYSANVTPELSFTINLKNLQVEDFANDFIIEVFKNTNNVLPFNCSTILHFDTKEKESDPDPQPSPEPEPQPQPQPGPEPEPVIQPQNIAFEVDSNPTNIIDAEKNLYYLKPTFSISPSPSFDFNDDEKAAIASAVTVLGADNSILTKVWNNGSLVLTFNKNLSSNTEYTLRMDAVNNLERLSVEPFEPLVFKTTNDYYIALSPDNDNVFVNENNLYHCRPGFKITSNIDLNDADKAKIASAVTVVGTEEANVSKLWENDSLIISFNQNLAQNTEYSVAITEIPEIEGKSFLAFQPFVFKTIGALNLTLTADNDNVYAAMSPLYQCRPTFTITPSMPLGEADRTKIANAVTLSNAANVVKDWNNEGSLRITFSQNLNSGTDFTLSMAAVNDIKGVTVTPFANSNFTTVGNLGFTITPDANNVYTALAPLYHCKPRFTITPSITLNDADKTNIENAVSVINSNVTSKAWNGNDLIITFSDSLTPNTAYTLSMGAVSGMDNINITTFNDQTFTTIPQLTFSITSADTNAFYDSKFHCNPTFTITPSFALNSGDKTTIENAISVSGVNSNNLSKTWNGNNLTLGFNQYIATSTDFTISMSAIDSLTGVKVTSLDDFEFSTIPDLIVTLATSSTTLVKKAASTTVLLVNGKNYCYCSDSSFTISTNMTLDSTNKAKIFDAISLTGIDSGLVSKSWNGEKVAISFNDELTASTGFSIQMAAINDINGVTVKPFSTYNCTTFFHKGKGTDADPFTVYTPAQLACLDLYPGEAYYYKQMENLDLSVYDNWKPIGSSTENLRFMGSYNGNNKNISSAVINHPNDNHVGLFCYTDRSSSTHGSIENLTLENFNVNGYNGVGALAGYAMRCELKNIQIKNSTVNGDNRVGGVAGYAITNYDKVLNVTAENITVTSRSDAGGLFGYNQNNTKENCGVINSNITSTGGTCGGIFAYSTNYTEVSTNCYVRNSTIRAKGYCGGYAGLLTNNNYANYLFEGCSVENCKIIRENDGNYTGGFIGLDDSRLSATYQSCNVASVTISSTGSYVGGFAGSFKGLALNSCNVASISMDTSGNYIGGLVGYNEGSITSCYSEKVKILAKSHSVGGLVGITVADSNIENCYVFKANINVDDASQNRQCYGGLVGQSAGTITKSYVYQSSIDSSQQVGGLVGYTTAGSISKCFVKDTSVKAYNFGVGGITAALFAQAQLDSCYVKSSNISFTVDATYDNHTIGGLVGSNTATISNSYLYDSTVSGKTNYGALIGSNEESGSVSDCFITDDYAILIENDISSISTTNCYSNVTNSGTFNGETWSTTSAWSNFNTTSFPPLLKDLAEP